MSIRSYFKPAGAAATSTEPATPAKRAADDDGVAAESVSAGQPATLEQKRTRVALPVDSPMPKPAEDGMANSLREVRHLPVFGRDLPHDHYFRCRKPSALCLHRMAQRFTIFCMF